MRTQQHFKGSGIHLIVPYDVDHIAFKWCSNVGAPGEIAIGPQLGDFEMLSPPGGKGYFIHLSQALAGEMNWLVSDKYWFRPHPDSLQALLSCCHALANALPTADQLIDPLFPLLQRNRLLAHLKEVLDAHFAMQLEQRSPVNATASRYNQILKEAIALSDYYEERGEALTVSQLADSVGVTPRTINRAFQFWAGLSAERFFLCKRLNRVRQQLTQSRLGRGRITRAFSDHGFTHLSRASQFYSELFGELPRETRYRDLDALRRLNVNFL